MQKCDHVQKTGRCSDACFTYNVPCDQKQRPACHPVIHLLGEMAIVLTVIIMLFLVAVS